MNCHSSLELDYIINFTKFANYSMKKMIKLEFKKLHSSAQLSMGRREFVDLRHSSYLMNGACSDPFEPQEDESLGQKLQLTLLVSAQG